MKAKWPIINLGCFYGLETQARVVSSIAVLTNILKSLLHGIERPIPNDTLIRSGLDPSYYATQLDILAPMSDDTVSTQASRHVNPLFRRLDHHETMAERDEAVQFRGDIAIRMWNDYLCARNSRR